MLGEKDEIVPGLRAFREATKPVIVAAHGLMGAFGRASQRAWHTDAPLLHIFGVTKEEA